MQNPNLKNEDFPHNERCNQQENEDEFVLDFENDDNLFDPAEEVLNEAFEDAENENPQQLNSLDNQNEPENEERIEENEKDDRNVEQEYEDKNPDERIMELKDLNNQLHMLKKNVEQEIRFRKQLEHQKNIMDQFLPEINELKAFVEERHEEFDKLNKKLLKQLEDMKNYDIDFPDENLERYMKRIHEKWIHVRNCMDICNKFFKMHEINQQLVHCLEKILDEFDEERFKFEDMKKWKVVMQYLPLLFKFL